MRKLVLGLLISVFLMALPSAADACLGPFTVPGTLTLERDGSYTCQATGPMTCPVGYKRTNVTAYIDFANMSCEIEWYCCKDPVIDDPEPNPTTLGAACLPAAQLDLPVNFEPELPPDVESAVEVAVEVAT